MNYSTLSIFRLYSQAGNFSELYAETENIGI